MSEEDKKLQKHLVDEMMQVYETNPNVMLYMQSLMENYQKLEQENKELKEDKKKVIEYIKELYIAEYDGNSYYIKDKNNNELGIEDIGENILEILGDKENE